MAHVVAPNLRGKAVSATKVTKDGTPKRSGNWSYQTVHIQSLQSRDYKVFCEDGHLVVGGNMTPLENIFGEAIVNAIANDPYFSVYRQDGVRTVKGKQYECHRGLRKCNVHHYDGAMYFYREEIYTDGDFDYTFPEY